MFQSACWTRFKLCQTDSGRSWGFAIVTLHLRTNQAYYLLDLLKKELACILKEEMRFIKEETSFGFSGIQPLEVFQKDEIASNKEVEYNLWWRALERKNIVTRPMHRVAWSHLIWLPKIIVLLLQEPRDFWSPVWQIVLKILAID